MSDRRPEAALRAALAILTAYERRGEALQPPQIRQLRESIQRELEGARA